MASVTFLANEGGSPDSVPDDHPDAKLYGGGSFSSGGSYNFRSTWGPARTTPSPDPTNPHANNMWRFGTANKCWAGQLGCQKEWYNHSWAWRKMVGIDEAKSRFMQSGNVLGVNAILKSLDPATGEYFQPDCWCYPLVTGDGDKYNATAKFLHGASGPNASTGTATTIRAGKGFGGAWDPDEWAVRVSLRTAAGHTRFSNGPGWNFQEQKPSELAIWFRYHFGSISGIWYPWDCGAISFDSGCIIEGCDENCYSFSFHPKGDPTDFCNWVEMKCSVCYSDGGADFRIIGGGGGERFTVYLDGEEVGTIGEYKGDGQTDVSGSISGEGLSKDMRPITLKSHVTSCVDTYQSQIDFSDASLAWETHGPAECDADCFDTQRKIFQFGKSVRSDKSSSSPMYKIKYTSTRCQCGWWQCFWPCNALFINFSEDGVNWVQSGAFPDAYLELGNHELCFVPLHRPDFKVNYISILTTTSPQKVGCTCASVSSVTALWNKVDDE